MKKIEFMISPSGSQYWLLNDKIHREDGPALFMRDGSQWEYRKGECFGRYKKFKEVDNKQDSI